MTRFISLIIILLILFSISLSHASVQTEGKLKALYEGSYALLIGVSTYRHWGSLDSVPKELDAVERILEEKGFTVIRHNDPDDRQLKAAFDNFISDHGYDRKNRLLIYFSGHGYSFPGQDDGFLVPINAPNPDINPKAFRRKAYSMIDVIAGARKIQAKHVLYLFDSCFSGTIFQTKNLPTPPKYISEATLLPVRQFITAGRATEVVPAQSTFTRVFVDALRYGWADFNKDGYVTGMELGVYLNGKVPQFVRQTPQFGKIRDYQLARGDFVFSVRDGIDWIDPKLVTNKKGIIETAQSLSRSNSSNTFTEPKTGIEFVKIPAGCFQMGSSYGFDDEKPVHRVCVNSFWLSKTEITQAQWKKVMHNNPSKFRDVNHPVENISWNDVQNFIKKLGDSYRLPTEAEWEYAAQAGSSGNYSKDANGKEVTIQNLGNYAWYGAALLTKNAWTIDRHRQVKQKNPNAFGLYDMHGNVWEWTCSIYKNPYDGSEEYCTHEDNTSHRALRGGAWSSDTNQLRSAYRKYLAPNYHSMSFGFRLLMTH